MILVLSYSTYCMYKNCILLYILNILNWQQKIGIFTLYRNFAAVYLIFPDSLKSHAHAQNLHIHIVRHVTGNDEDYLRLIPRVVWQTTALDKGPLQVYCNLCYQVKLRYEASQVWLNATFYSTRSAIIGLAVET